MNYYDLNGMIDIPKSESMAYAQNKKQIEDINQKLDMHINDENNNIQSEVERLTLNIENAVEETERKLDEATASINSEMGNINSRIYSELETVNDKIENAVDSVNSSVNARLDKVNGRIDNIIANTSSTEGNSELVDIRLSATGKIYQTAGEAVREQILRLNRLTGKLVCKSNNYPNFDTESRQLTIQKDTLLADSISHIYYWTTEDTVVDFNSYYGETVSILAFDKNTHELKMFGYTEPIPDTYRCTGYINRMGQGDIGCPYTVNNVDINQLVNEHTNRLNSAEAYISQSNDELTDIRTGAEGKRYSTAGEAVRNQILKLNRFTGKMVIANSDYPDFNTESRQLTVKKGTLLADYISNVYYWTTEDSIVDFNNYYGQTVSVLAFDKSTHELKMFGYTEPIPDTYRCIGYINKVGQGDIGCTYTINGVDINKSIENIEDLVQGSNIEENILSLQWERNVQEVQKAQGTAFTFAIQTDTHIDFDNSSGHNWSDGNAANNLKLFAQRAGLDFYANLGDIIEGYATDSTDDMRSDMTEIVRRYVQNAPCPVLIALGNHDSNIQSEVSGGEIMTNEELYARLMKPIRNTSDRFVFGGKVFYYYIDFDEIRVIVINTQDGANTGVFSIGDEQLKWLREKALDTTKAVMIMGHSPLISEIGSNVPKNSEKCIEAVSRFIQSGGVFIGFFYGHQHEQRFAEVNGMNHITFDNLANKAEVVMVDIDNRTVNTLPIGASGINVRRSFTF